MSDRRCGLLCHHVTQFGKRVLQNVILMVSFIQKLLLRRLLMLSPHVIDLA